MPPPEPTAVPDTVVTLAAADANFFLLALGLLILLQAATLITLWGSDS